MPSLKIYDLFISHAWSYNDDYQKLVAMLDNASNFLYRNYSAPKDKPLHNLNATDATTKKQIKDAIDRKILPVNVVLVSAGMYYHYHEWMQYEIKTAAAFSKPIIAIKPFGNSIMPNEVNFYATKIVNWNTDSIISAIRQYSI